jgi:hypothetical protein
MTRDAVKNKRLVSLFLFCAVLLNYPLLSLFNHERMIFGIPMLYLYIFVTWTLIIFLCGLITSAPQANKKAGKDPSTDR